MEVFDNASGIGAPRLLRARIVPPPTATAANSVASNADTYGVLKMTLHPASADFQFVPVAGQTFTDSGTIPCH